MNKGKIIFFGTPEFAVASLDALHNAGYDIAAVVTATDKPAGRGHKLLPSAVKQYALDHNIEVLQPEKLRDEQFLSRLREINADLFVVIAFRMLPEVVWAMPRLGTFNLHGSLLPAYRGAAPINRAIMNGETKTGVTTFFLTHEIDTGDIIDYREIDIADDENVGSVHDRLMEVGAELTVSTADAIFNETVTATPQQDIIDRLSLTPSPAPKIFRDDRLIDWNRPAREIYNQIRGLSPYPGALARLNVNGEDVDVKILKSHIDDYSSAPHDAGLIGDVRQFDNYGATPLSKGGPAIRVTTAVGSILLDLIQIPGKKPCTPTDLHNGKINIRRPN